MYGWVLYRRCEMSGDDATRASRLVLCQQCRINTVVDGHIIVIICIASLVVCSLYCSCYCILRNRNIERHRLEFEAAAANERIKQSITRNPEGKTKLVSGRVTE